MSIRAGEIDPDYNTLTSLLHWKTDSNSINQKALDEIYHRLFTSSTTTAFHDQNALVVDLIKQEAEACVLARAGANFENKIVLAIASRLAAEKFMVNKIADPAFLASIGSNQTPELLKKLKQTHAGSVKAIKVLNSVVLMTPQNIHLNAFMYEPILDMSDDFLRKLYNDVTALT